MGEKERWKKKKRKKEEKKTIAEKLSYFEGPFCVYFSNFLYIYRYHIVYL